MKEVQPPSHNFLTNQETNDINWHRVESKNIRRCKLKKTIVCVLLVTLAATAVGFAGAWINTRQDLKATENALLNEANFSQKQQETLRDLREENIELKARSDRLEGERDSLWVENQKLKTRLESTLNRSIIVGRVYTDNNCNQALDLNDRMVTENIVGFDVVLYEAIQEKGSPVSKRVASTTVSNGQYMFNVEPGEYFIGISYLGNQLFYRRYNHIIYLGDSSNIIAERGQIIIGPDILLSYGSGGKG